MNIYIIIEHTSTGNQAVAYSTNRKKVDEYLSLTTGKDAYEWIDSIHRNWYEESLDKQGYYGSHLFKNHLPNIRYKSNENPSHFYSFRIEKSI